MLVRQFSLRMLLAVMTACAGISMIFSLAVQQRAWSIALLAFLIALVVMMLVQAAAFTLVWLLGLLDRRRGNRSSAALEPAADSIAAEH
jgi:hypothetical protein